MTVTDHVAGSDGDSGLLIGIACPACGGTHRVALARIGGRFMLTCGDTEMSGQVDDWAAVKAVAGPLSRREGDA